MKYLSGLIITTAVLLTLQSGDLAAQSFKVGVVDLQRCILESNEGKRIQERLQNMQRRIEEDLGKRQNELENMMKDIEKQSLMLSMDAREDRQREIEKKQRDLNYYYQDVSEEFQKAENEARNEILTILMTVVNKIAERDKYDLITERSGGGVLYVSSGLDITNEVLKELNQLKQQ